MVEITVWSFGLISEIAIGLLWDNKTYMFVFEMPVPLSVVVIILSIIYCCGVAAVSYVIISACFVVILAQHWSSTSIHHQPISITLINPCIRYQLIDQLIHQLMYHFIHQPLYRFTHQLMNLFVNSSSSTLVSSSLSMLLVAASVTMIYFHLYNPIAIITLVHHMPTTAQTTTCVYRLYVPLLHIWQQCRPVQLSTTHGVLDSSCRTPLIHQLVDSALSVNSDLFLSYRGCFDSPHQTAFGDTSHRTWMSLLVERHASFYVSVTLPYMVHMLLVIDLSPSILARFTHFQVNPTSGAHTHHTDVTQC